MIVGPDIMGSGTVPWKSDTIRISWLKKLQTIQNNQASPLAHNNPRKGDTIRMLIEKCVRAVKGI